MGLLDSVWDAIRPQMPLAAYVSENILRLVLAAVLGGVIGLERELKHKPAGLRTNMFICFGAAMFTVLSFRFAENISDPTRIASNIIPGIGFIGAGSILHSRGSVSGLTTAATLFVVASIGMAAGGGQYLTAIFATMVILLALNVLGWAEQKFNLKSSLVGYAVTSRQPEQMLMEINKVLADMKLTMQSVNMNAAPDGSHRLHFTVNAKHQQQEELAEHLRGSQKLERVEMLRSENGE
jgi:putative Mg2+ transporter-C (MgtC) family protein